MAENANLKFGTHSPDMTPEKCSKEGRGQGYVTPYIFGC